MANIADTRRSVTPVWAPRLVNGIVLNAVEWPGPSEAPLIILIHSLGCDHRIWEGVAGRLADRARVVAYDIRGHGLSTVSPDATLEDHAADVLALIEASDAGTAILCGISIGGQIAMAAALAGPDRVHALILADTGARIGTPERYADRAARVRAGGIAVIARGQIDRWFASGFAERAPATVAAVQAMLERQPVVGYLAGVAMLSSTDLGSEVKSLSCPTLCLCGAQDVSTPPEDMTSLTGLISGARLTIIDGAGHLPCIEAPGDMADHIAAFLIGLA